MIGVDIEGGFRVIRLIGEGGMGKVYEGEQRMGSATRKVAIKTLHPHLSNDPELAARFHRECGTVIKLLHPNTIKFFAFGQAPQGRLFIAMEFLEGHPISKILSQYGPMPPARVENTMRQICGSLSEAHSRGIIHRDLKPDNIILSDRVGVQGDFVTVLDFGIAARTEACDSTEVVRMTQQGTILGTPPYMSPEQFTGQALDGRSDVYSLAIMAYEMLVGKLPFTGSTAWDWAFQHLKERPTPFERPDAPHGAAVPLNMKQAIMRALSKDRDARQADVEAFFRELSGSTASDQPQPPSAGSDSPGFGAPKLWLGPTRLSWGHHRNGINPNNTRGPTTSRWFRPFHHLPHNGSSGSPMLPSSEWSVPWRLLGLLRLSWPPPEARTKVQGPHSRAARLLLSHMELRPDCP